MGAEKHDFDLFVIGAGSGGLAAAKRAASYGARVAIAEADRFGGTCVIRGCVPKKIMVYASQLGTARKLASDYGWEAAPPGFSWARLCQIRDQVVNNLELAHQRHLAEAGVTAYSGQASLVSPHGIALGDKRWTARHILVATGATPRLPSFPGADLCLTSGDLFNLPTMPSQAILVGGGYIAVEFACLLQILGCQVTLIARSRLLRDFDADIAQGVTAAVRKLGITVHEAASIEALQKQPDGLVATVPGKAPVKAQACVLFAAGRLPNTAGLGLSEVGVQLGERGEVVVDEHHTTAVPSIHAVGDVLDKANLTPVAIRAGRTWADRLFGGKDQVMRYNLIPTAVFSQPPVGTVGLTQEQAIASLGAARVQVFKTRFIPLMFSASPAERKNTSTMKVLVDRDTDRVLGIHMLGDDAPEIIQGFAAAMQANLTKTQLDATLAVHPTQAEEFVLMR